MFKFALQNGGGIRASIDEGEVTLGEVLNVLPFGNLVSTMALSGEDVWAAMENSVSRVDVDEGTGRFLQVAGMRYTFDASQEVGSRIVSIDIWNAETSEYEPLDLEATYTVALNDFIRNGGDAYSMFAENAIDPYDFGRPLDQVLAEYIENNSPVEIGTEDRITEVMGE